MTKFFFTLEPSHSGDNHLKLKGLTPLSFGVALAASLTACSAAAPRNTVNHPDSTVGGGSWSGSEMISIPAGTFSMGDDHSGHPDEKPAHHVQIAAFKISRNEITVRQYREFVQANQYEVAGPCWGWQGAEMTTNASWNWRNPGYDQEDSHPVACVSWDDAQQFIKWLNKTQAPAKPYRLATEAEWEYAARASKQTSYPWGEFPVDNAVNCWVCGEKFKHTSPVGTFSASNWGINDLSGNVWEWVEDCYRMNYQSAPTNGSAVLYANCPSRIVRGGSWADKVNFLRSAYRLPYLSGYRNQAVGFRLAQDI